MLPFQGARLAHLHLMDAKLGTDIAFHDLRRSSHVHHLFNDTYIVSRTCPKNSSFTPLQYQGHVQTALRCVRANPVEVVRPKRLLSILESSFSLYCLASNSAST